MVALSTLYLCAALAASPDAVLLEFYSPSCGPCQSMQGTIDRLKKDGYPIQQINVAEAPDVARQFQIRHVPTCVLVMGGKEVSRLDGVRSRDEIESVFEQAAKLAAQQVPAQQVTAQASQPEEFVVRGQSPEGRRGLGLFNRLGNKKPADAGAPPVQIPTSEAPVTGGAAVAQPETTFGRDDAFAKRAPVSGPTPNALPVATQPKEEQPEVRTADIKTASPSERALAATVRLKIQDATGVSFGTGTIIDVMKDEALVVTCGHIFRDSKGKGKILVDLYEGQQPVPGQLISFDLTRDIALVSIRPGVTVAAAPVALDASKIVPQTRVFSVGCDGGQEASVRESRITAVDKYTGSPNYTTTGMPVQGRSGGGLFLADGTLIGICNAADEKDDEGLYAGLGTIHWQLDQIGQAAIYQRTAKPAEALAAIPTVAPPANELPARALAAAPAPMPSIESEKEIIFFMRDKNQPHARGEAIVVNPTPELMEMLNRAARPAAVPLTAAAPQPTGMRSLPEEAPIVRGQNR